MSKNNCVNVDRKWYHKITGVHLAIIFLCFLIIGCFSCWWVGVVATQKHIYDKCRFGNTIQLDAYNNAKIQCKGVK